MSPYDVLSDLAACLCASLTPEDADGPNLCFCGVLAGDQPYDAMGIGEGCDDDTCGQAWVRMVNSYPSTSVGVADLEPNNCAKALGLDIEVGVLRCFPLEENGGILSAEDLDQAVRDQLDDMIAMQRAILCCSTLEDYVLGMYLPMGPIGNVIGGTWTLSVLI